MGVPAGRDRKPHTRKRNRPHCTVVPSSGLGAAACLYPPGNTVLSPPTPPAAFFAQGAVGRMDEDVRETVLITDPTAFKSLGSKYGRGKRNGEDDWYELALLSSSRVLHLT